MNVRTKRMRTKASLKSLIDISTRIPTRARMVTCVRIQTRAQPSIRSSRVRTEARVTPLIRLRFRRRDFIVKTTSTFLFVLICSLALVTGADSRAASHLDITIETKPASQTQERTAEFSNLVKTLESSDPAARATAACQLGKMHEAAARAIPNLIKLLADNTRVDFNGCDNHDNSRHRFGDSDEEQTVGKFAAVALSQIGKS